MTSHTGSASNNLCEVIDAYRLSDQGLCPKNHNLCFWNIWFQVTYTDHFQGNSQIPQTMPSYRRLKIEAADLHSSESYSNRVDKTHVIF